MLQQQKETKMIAIYSKEPIRRAISNHERIIYSKIYLHFFKYVSCKGGVGFWPILA